MTRYHDFAEEGRAGFGSFRAASTKASHRRGISISQRHHFQPRIHVMPIDQPAAGWILRTITIRLGADAADQRAEARHDLALSALAAAIIAVDSSISPAWTLQPTPGGEPLLFNLTPLPGHAVSVAAAWEVAYALRSQPQVAAAEPTFTPAPGYHQTANGMP